MAANLVEMENEEKQRKWAEAQNRVFSRWVNLHLSRAGLKIEDVRTDFSDGLNLFKLTELLSGSTIQANLNKSPKNKLQKVENISYSLNFLKTKKIQVTCSNEDIVEGNLKMILGLLWTLILSFQIPGGKKGLIEWVNEMLSKPNIKLHHQAAIGDFRSSWQDGLAFLAIIEAKCPGSVDLTSISRENGVQNLLLAFDLAYEKLGIAKILEVEDLQDVDERIIMTYVSFFRNTEVPKEPPPPPPPVEVPPPPPPEPVIQIVDNSEELKQLREELEELKVTLERKDAESKMLKGEITKRDHEISNLRMKLFEGGDKTESLQKELDDKTKEVEEKNNEIARLEEELEIVKSKSRSEVGYLTQSYRTIQAQLVEMRNKNADMDKKMEWMIGQIREYQRQNVAVSEEARMLENELERLKKENEELTSKLHEMESKAAETNKKTQQMSTWFVGKKSSNVSHEDFTRVSDDVSRLVEEQDKFKAEVEALNLKNQQTMEYLKKLNEQLRSVVIKSEETQKKYEELQKEHSKCHPMLDKEFLTIKKANEIVHLTKKKLEVATMQLKDLEEEYTLVVKHLEGLFEKLAIPKEHFPAIKTSIHQFVETRRKFLEKDREKTGMTPGSLSYRGEKETERAGGSEIMGRRSTTSLQKSTSGKLNDKQKLKKDKDKEREKDKDKEKDKEKEKDKDKDREREKDREKDRDREKEKEDGGLKKSNSQKMKSSKKIKEGT